MMKYNIVIDKHGELLDLGYKSLLRGPPILTSKIFRMHITSHFKSRNPYFKNFSDAEIGCTSLQILKKHVKMMIFYVKIINFDQFCSKKSPSGEPLPGVTLGGGHASGGPLRGG